MPNHCSNSVTITGPNDTIKEIASRLKEDTDGNLQFDFEQFLPMPVELKGIVASYPPAKVFTKDTGVQVYEEDLGLYKDSDGKTYNREECEYRNLTDEECENLRKEFGAVHWYEWYNKTIGTKWGYYEQTVEVREGSISISAQSAWCPASSGLIAFSKLYPDVVIQNAFSEPGAGFLGLEEIAKGDVETLHSYEGNFYEDSDDEEYEDEGHYVEEVEKFLDEHSLN